MRPNYVVPVLIHEFPVTEALATQTSTLSHFFSPATLTTGKIFVAFSQAFLLASPLDSFSTHAEEEGPPCRFVLYGIRVEAIDENLCLGRAFLHHFKNCRAPRQKGQATVFVLPLCNAKAD